MTNGQIPSWLNLDNPRLTIVTHKVPVYFVSVVLVTYIYEGTQVQEWLDEHGLGLGHRSYHNHVELYIVHVH